MVSGTQIPFFITFSPISKKCNVRVRLPRNVKTLPYGTSDYHGLGNITLNAETLVVIVIKLGSGADF